MKIKQTLILLSAAFIFALGLFSVNAQPVAAQSCGEVETSIINCDIDENAEGVEATGLWSVLLLVINILTGLIAVAALGGLIYGAVMYTSAGGNVEQTKKAMGIITNVVIGVVAYGLMFAGLNFLIPGGVFN
ncbi:MAG TPA: hypothetical protein QF549_02495 [Candidatus Saccharimonadaceae bacterium]|mgnify:CR=1 FL=1|nr:hypothetical protein [Candidatus Saccharimonadaceae bacterium]|tara:strand:+ start:1378 stop:1773 length:396 start_codon:yes stop_codon:yes gene_type:complete